MTLTVDISNDFSYVDGTETVTLNVGEGVSVAGCVTSPLTRKQVAMLGAVGTESQYRNFSLPVASLDGHEPSQGQSLTDGDGVNWSIESCELRTMDTRWLCLCRRQVAQ